MKLSDAARKMKSLKLSGNGSIMNMRGGTMARIMSPIEQRNTGKGNPSAILHFDRPLNNRQQRLLALLPEVDSRATVKKQAVSMRDLSALTAHTGAEYAMFTRKGERMLVRGNPYETRISEEDLKKMHAEGWRWSGHTHPGTTSSCLLSSSGDKAVLRIFGQQYSCIYNSVGMWEIFDKE